MVVVGGEPQQAQIFGCKRGQVPYYFQRMPHALRGHLRGAQGLEDHADSDFSSERHHDAAADIGGGRIRRTIVKKRVDWNVECNADDGHVNRELWITLLIAASF